jgi:hypothetical protein
MKSFINLKFIASLLIALPLIVFSLSSHAEKVKTGEFTGASDHITSGQVSVVKTPDGYAVVLGSDFSLDGAPDPKVGFGKDGKYDIKAQLGHLISKDGQQAYVVPASVNPKDYNEVYIWCEKFNVPLGVATIK